MSYTTHPDAIFDVGKPILGSTGLEARDNLIAAMQGDPTAPALALGAIEPVAAGDQIRSVSAPQTQYYFAFMQKGSVRVDWASADASTAVVRRFRNATQTTLASTVNGSITSVDVQPFDVLGIRWIGQTDETPVGTVTLRTNGTNLWCANPTEMVGVTGNNV